MPRLLLIDDDRSLRTLIAGALKEIELELQVAATATEGIALLQSNEPDVVLLDVMLPDMSGIDACRQIHAIAPKVPVIFITAGGSSDTAIEAMRLGAFDYLLKPLDLARVHELVTQALEIRRLMHVPVQLQADDDTQLSGDLLVGRTPQMQDVYKAIGRVAPQDVATLIRGESGSGKELVARAIYHHSRRANGPFLAVNCAALPESLLESELFGHEKGSFTGATGRRIGKFEQCNGGTLFFDEVGDMTPLVQSKVLRVLQEQRFERVGGIANHSDRRADHRRHQPRPGKNGQATESSAQTCTIASTVSRFNCRRCASAPRTFACCSNGTSPGSAGSWARTCKASPLTP